MPGTRSATNAASPKPGVAVRSAVTRYVQNRCGSSSVKGQPGNGLPVTRPASPFGQQCGLSPPCWGNDDREFFRVPFIESVGQPLATHDSGMQKRRGELGRKQLPDSVYTNIRI